MHIQKNISLLLGMFEIDIASSVPSQYAFLESPIKRGTFYGKFMVNSYIYVVILFRVPFTKSFKEKWIWAEDIFSPFKDIQII